MKFLATFIVLVGAVAATESEVGRKCPEPICIDGVNPCGVQWGGCYDLCRPNTAPKPPPCPSKSSIMTVTKKTQRPTPTPTRTTKDDCEYRTVCVDYVNECGMRYGTCHNDCEPWPKPTPPPCPKSETPKSDAVTTHGAN